MLNLAKWVHRRIRKKSSTVFSMLLIFSLEKGVALHLKKNALYAKSVLIEINTVVLENRMINDKVTDGLTNRQTYIHILSD